MKSTLLLLSGTAFAVLSFLSATYAASIFMTDGEANDFRHIEEPLWKSEPTYLDRGNMTLTEVEVRYGRNLASPAENAQQAIPHGDSAGNPAQAAASNPAHADWCMARYRSYQPEDNTYQPYGGPRRTCESPYAGSSPIIESAEAEAAITEEAQAQQAVALDVATWCRSQYRSYRASDNTYQPFSGPRKVCVPQAY